MPAYERGHVEVVGLAQVALEIAREARRGRTARGPRATLRASSAGTSGDRRQQMGTGAAHGPGLRHFLRRMRWRHSPIVVELGGIEPRAPGIVRRLDGDDALVHQAPEHPLDVPFHRGDEGVPGQVVDRRG